MKLTRRDCIYLIGGAIAGAGGVLGGSLLKGRLSSSKQPVVLNVNDIHSQLNPARLKAIEAPESLEELIGAIRRASRQKDKICISGSRHAMGGQQFANDAVMIDTRGMKSIMDLDTKSGLVMVEAGIEWPDLVTELHARQKGLENPWTIRCKQTGADKLTLGGAIAANAHGRTLSHPPMSADIEEFLLVNADGDALRCSRSRNQELFSLALGGYGLFGVVHSVTYRLERRHKLERTVEMVRASDVIKKFDQRIKDGYTLGDWQYAVDEESNDFLDLGVFSCYKPVELHTPIKDDQVTVSDKAWQELVYLAHTDKTKAFKLYSDFYLKSSGQIYWSDTSQIGGYDEDYHKDTDRRMGVTVPSTEMITEIDVPRDRLADFLAAASERIRKLGAQVIYGTVRLVEKDTDSLLAWAKQPYACVIFNLHVEHSDEKIKSAAEAFKMLIDLAIERDGSYYLTYHRWADREQVLSCYPQFPEFLNKKKHYDPNGLFQSEWLRHYEKMFAS